MYEENFNSFKSKTYTWRENDTLMQMILLTGESINPAVTFGVWRFPEKKE